MVVITEKKALKQNKMRPVEQQWDNPMNPEKSADERDIEQLKRQKKDAELKNKNITDKESSTN